MPALWISSRSSVPKEGVSFGLSASRASCIAVRVFSGIFPLVLIHTSVVMECVANSSFPSRHQPLCLLHLPSAPATNCASLKGGWVLLLAPSGWVTLFLASLRFCVHYCIDRDTVQKKNRASRAFFVVMSTTNLKMIWKQTTNKQMYLI